MMVIWKENYNTQVFDLGDKDGMERGMAFIKTLLDDAKKNDHCYNDIHTYVEEHLLIVSWTQVYYDHRGESGSFQFVDCDQCVMKEIYFPDKHYEYVSSPEEEEERWEEWHKENPQWVKTSYGTWTNEEENKRWQEEIMKQRRSVSDPDMVTETDLEGEEKDGM